SDGRAARDVRRGGRTRVGGLRSGQRGGRPHPASAAAVGRPRPRRRGGDAPSSIRRLPPLCSAPARAVAPTLPARLDETYEGAMSTQEAFGRVLGARGRGAAGDAVGT